MPLTAVESRLASLATARARPLLDDLRRLVAIPTGQGFARGLDETRSILCERLARLGAAVELVPGEARPDWLHGTIAGAVIPPTAVCRRRRSGRPILLSGHLDTVHDPAGSFRELGISPDGARATGPGAADMKGGLLVAIHALEVLAEAGVEPNWTFALNSDEETGSYHSERALDAEARRAVGGIGLVFEPALPDGSLVVERGGSGQFMLEVHGRSAHVGRDFQKGVSAVTALAERLVAISRMPDAARGLIATVGPIEGGSVTNAVPDHARAWGNLRFQSSEGAEELRRKLESLATPAGAMPRATVLTSFNRAAKPLTDSIDRLAQQARLAAEDLGQRLPFGKTGGVCDGNILQNAGLPTIDTLGVRGDGLHTPQEWVDVSSLVERTALSAVLISRLAAS